MPAMTRSDLAKKLGVSISTLRAWERHKLYSEKFTTPTPATGDNDEKVYTAHDVTLFTLIRRGRLEKRTHDDIASTIDQDIERYQDADPTLDDIAEEAMPKAPPETRQLAVYVAKLEATNETHEQTIVALTRERDAAVERRVDAERRAAAAEAKLEMLQGTTRRSGGFWRRLFGGSGESSSATDQDQDGGAAG